MNTKWSVNDTKTVLTATWDTVATAQGFSYWKDCVRISYTMDGSRTSARFGLDGAPHIFEVYALGKLDHATTAYPLPVTPPPPPPPATALLTQGYTATEMQKLLTDGNLVRVAADRLTATSPTLVRFEVRPGDTYSSWSGERSQIQLPQIQGGEGDTWRWSFDFTLDPAFQFSGGFYNVLWEHHHTGSTGSPPSTLQLHGDRLVWRQAKVGDPAQSNYWTETDLAAAAPGVSHKVLVDCSLSTDPAKAKTAVTVDGKTTVIGGANLLDGMRVYVEWGLYRALAQLTQAVSFGPVSRLA